MFKLSVVFITLCLNVLVHCQTYKSYLVAGFATPTFITSIGSAVPNGISLYDVAWNTSQAGSTHGSVPTIGKPNFGDITITKQIDANTNTMLLAVSTGKVLADLFIYTYVVNGAGAGSKFLTFEIQKVMVTSCNLDLSTGQETTTLNFAKITSTFGQSGGPSNAPSNGSPFSWNIASSVAATP